MVASAPALAVVEPVAPHRRRPRAIPLVVALFTVLAAFLRLYRLRYGYAHGVVDYDSGVYFGSSLELVDGHLPYRDFVFVHPPAITLLFAPDALLAKVIGTAQAMGIAKIMTALAGAASVPLVGWLVRRRGVVAVVLACGVVAVQGDAVAAGYTLLLEPWLVLFCLLGAVLVFDGDQVSVGRRLRWGGVLFGIACATKIWAIAPVLAIALILLPQRRKLWTYVSGAALGFLVPVLPFLLTSPLGFVHQVFTVQIFRSSAGPRTPVWLRLIHMFSVAAPNADVPSAAVGGLLAGVTVLLAGLALVWARRVRSANPLERFALLGAVLIVAMLLVPDTFYWHYAAFSAPFVALAATMPLDRLRPVSRRVWTAVLAIGVLGLTLTMAHRDLRRYRVLDDHVAVDAVVPAGACLVSSNPSAAIAEDRFHSDRADCPVLLDSFGTVLDLADGESPSVTALRTPSVRALWLRLYEHADYLYLKQQVSPTIPSDPVLRGYLHEHFHVIPIDAGGTLYARN